MSSVLCILLLLGLFLNMVLLYGTLSLQKTNIALNVYKTDFYCMPPISLRPVTNHDYSLIREILQIQSLSSRRFAADQQFVNSLLNGFLDAPDILERVYFIVPSYYTRNQFPFSIPSHSTAYGHNHPLHRMLRNYNS